MLIVKIICRDWQLIKISYRFGIFGSDNPAVFSKSNTLEVFDFFVIAFFNQPDQFQESIFALAYDNKIYLWEMFQEKFPQKSSSNTTENDLYLGIDLFSYLGNLYASPTVHV